MDAVDLPIAAAAVAATVAVAVVNAGVAPFLAAVRFVFFSIDRKLVNAIRRSMSCWYGLFCFVQNHRAKQGRTGRERNVPERERVSEDACGVIVGGGSREGGREGGLVIHMVLFM